MNLCNWGGADVQCDYQTTNSRLLQAGPTHQTAHSWVQGSYGEPWKSCPQSTSKSLSSFHKRMSSRASADRRDRACFMDCRTPLIAYASTPYNTRYPFQVLTPHATVIRMEADLFITLHAVLSFCLPGWSPDSQNTSWSAPCLAGTSGHM